MAKPRIDPVKRVVPKAPDGARQKRSETPFPPARVIPLSGKGPEDVVVDADGKLIVGLEDGRVMSVDPETGAEKTIGNTGGRPLGLEILDDGRLLVCDSYKGLLRLDAGSGDIETLVESVDGESMTFCSNATVQRDGTIWFTESTNRFHFDYYVAALVEHRPSGRLFRRDPDGTVEVVLRDLYFTNGITLNEDESAILFAETGAYRISRMPLEGGRAGEVEIILDNLPGFPDNMSRMNNGRTWVAMPNPRDRRLDALASSPPLFRKMLWATPDWMTPEGKRTTWVMAINERGEVLADLQEPRRDYHMVTGATEHNGKLYLSSIKENGILELDLSETPIRGER